MREMRERWRTTEAAWEASPFAGEGARLLVTDILRRSYEGLKPLPAWPVVLELGILADSLLDLEEIGALVPDWDLIDASPSVAVGIRHMLTRRYRWVSRPTEMSGYVSDQLARGFRDFLHALPEPCFEEWDPNEEPPFAVPLFSMLEHPGAVMDGLFLSLYSDHTLHYEIFRAVREWITANMVVASGFRRDADLRPIEHRLLRPSEQKGKSAGELVDLYFAGTPFTRLLNLPVPFTVPDAVRFEHTHIIGGTGHGKTQLLQRMIHNDLLAAKDDGRAVVVIDSQGDLINKLVRLDLFAPDAPNSLADRLVIIDPADVEFPPALNLFDAHLDRVRDYRPVDRERVLNGVIELYETFFGALLGAELTQKQGVIFRYLARLLITIPGATIHTLMQLMEDGKPYKPQMEALDGSARYFFETEFFHPSFSATKKQILKRLWGVLSTPAFERMFTQRENKLDMFEALNAGSIVLVNTAKDLLKTEGSQLFGRFFIALLSQAALERSTVPERKRTPTFVYVDEAQEYFDDTIETILTQARKYKVGIAVAHQTLDQLSPRLRSAFLSNTSFKCVGGVSSKDARALASELHTSTEFIEGMRRRGQRTEFAVWVKHRTPEAIQLTVPLGHLERQPTLSEEEYDALIDVNRARYCGTVETLWRSIPAPSATLADPVQLPPQAPAPIVEPADEQQPPRYQPPSPPVVTPPRPDAPRELGKGGPKHRYLQNMVKELAEQQGFRATIEAALRHTEGQVDVLLERDDLRIAVEVSVTTPADYERQNVRKCLDAGFARVAVVLAKSRTAQGRYQSAILDGLGDDDRARIAFLRPEDIPDFIASLASAPETTETIVKGYRVRVSQTTITPEEAKSRRDALAKLISRSVENYQK